MKIKLVTFAPHANYGTCLQSYALNKVLRDMGHDVEFIYNGRENPPLPFSLYIKKNIIAIIKWILPESIVLKIKEKRKKKETSQPVPSLFILQLPDHPISFLLSKFTFCNSITKILRCHSLQQKKIYSFTFEEGNYKMKKIYLRKQYDEVVEDADVFVTGSDQIWNPYCGGFNPMMFLEFAKDKKRIAFSSSIAIPRFPFEIEQRAKEDLLKFSHIAVREKSSVLMLKSLLHREDVELVVDPTMLLTKEEWRDFGNLATIEFELPSQYIFCYFIGDRIGDYIAMVEDVKKKTHIENVITMNCTTNSINIGGGIYYKDGGPREFVYLLSHAAMVCLDSFHGTIFALKFGVNFVHILKNEENSVGNQNSRMHDLLDRYEIRNKLYRKDSDEWLAGVDNSCIWKKMEEDIHCSMNYLTNAIEN